VCTVLRIDAAAGSHVGCVRHKNEDSFAAVPELGLFVVADGMGGHAGGEVASRLAVDTLRAWFAEGDDPDETWPRADSSWDRHEMRLLVGIRRANEAVYNAARRDCELRDMGTTLVAALIRDGRVYLAHVGDSRIYRVRGGAIERLTRDHTVGETATRQGISMGEIDHRIAEMLDRSIGTAPRVEVEMRSENMEPGDVLLLCTDGLWAPVSEEEIAATLAWPSRPEVIVAGLIGRALEHGGPDNVTCVVVRAAGQPERLR
jgi:serine/threonine protein phosphatase PrpC